MVQNGARLDATAPELFVYAPGDRPARLAWKIELTRLPGSRWLVVVDAVNGARLTVIDEIETEKATGSGRDLSGATRALNIWKEGNT